MQRKERNVAVLDMISKRFLTNRQRRNREHAVKEKASGNDGKDRPSVVPGIRDLLCEQDSHVICEAVKSPLRDVEGCAAVLQETMKYPGGYGFRG